MSRKHTLIAAALVAAPIVLASVVPALASSGGSLPWEGPLQQIQESITGPVAGAIALAAVAIAGGMLIFGGELNDFARRLVYVVLVAGILLGRSWLAGTSEAGRTRLMAVFTPVFPLHGRDLTPFGVPSGPEMGVILRQLRAWWLQGGCLADRAACLSELRRRHANTPP